MASHNLLLALLILFANSMSMAASGDSCRRKCGKVEIPYPFGMSEECYHDVNFKIRCNESTGSATLAWFQDNGYSNVIDFISTSTHSLRLNNIPALDFSLTQRFLYSPTLVDSRYFLSFTKNAFVLMGCDIFVYLSDEDTQEFLGGCGAICNHSDIISSPSSPCSGILCCQLSVPKRVRNMTFSFDSIVHARTNSSGNYSKCGFFTFMDKDFLHAVNMEPPQCNKSYYFPLTYEWAVGNTSCNTAKGRKDYACGRNTGCFNNDAGKGYRCKCRSGYKGNPYLPDGCQDIDECANAKENHCPRENPCVNTQGGHFCLPNHRRLFALLIPLGTGLAFCLLILIGIGFWGWRKFKEIKDRKMKQNFFKKNGGLLLQQQISSCATKLLLELTFFKNEELEKATDKFSENRILGKGGLGTVYKGMLSDGRIVAVKKANIIDDSQVDQFINEVFILSQINHRHIVKLYGCCLETQVPLLIYEYISNGTLSHHLHDETNMCTISWEDRLRIAAEVAGALSYLHSCASTAIFHRDIKSSNILLDEKYKAVISDFGLSRSVSIDKTHLTTVVGGTFGYLDPEYFLSGQLNDKSDVYAFGVVLAEILTGQKAISSNRDDIGLVLRFRSAVKEQRLFEILDEVVAREGQKEEIVTVAKLAKRCMKINARKRPCMKEVATELEQLRKTKEFFGHEESFADKHGFESENSCHCSIDSEVEDDQTLSKTN